LDGKGRDSRHGEETNWLPEKSIHKASLECRQKISKYAKVHRKHVYRKMPKLEKMGLVEIVLGIPDRCCLIENFFSKADLKSRRSSKNKT
jgi:hypothetical protein